MSFLQMYEIKNEDIHDILFSLTKKYILPKFKNLKKDDIKRKGNNDLVTSVDLIIEEQLKIYLNKLIPSSLFVGEESFENDPSIINNYKENQYCWTVDPIDGTTNFSKGKEKFAIMICLTFNKQILQSWIYKPLLDEMCSSLKDNGSYINDNRTNTNHNTLIENASGSISTKYWNNENISKINKIKNKFKEVSSYGCIGFEYVDIANGNRDFAIMSKLTPWDNLPGILISRESGGFDSYFDLGNYDFQFSKYNLVVANNNILGNKILNLINGE